jgi:hypothetical protein
MFPMYVPKKRYLNDPTVASSSRESEYVQDTSRPYEVTACVAVPAREGELFLPRHRR